MVKVVVVGGGGGKSEKTVLARGMRGQPFHSRPGPATRDKGAREDALAIGLANAAPGTLGLM